MCTGHCIKSMNYIGNILNCLHRTSMARQKHVNNERFSMSHNEKASFLGLHYKLQLFLQCKIKLFTQQDV